MMRELKHVSAFIFAFDEYVKVIGHKAIREDCHVALCGRAQNLPADQINSRGARKDFFALMRAKC